MAAELEMLEIDIRCTCCNERRRSRATPTQGGRAESANGHEIRLSLGHCIDAMLANASPIVTSSRQEFETASRRSLLMFLAGINSRAARSYAIPHFGSRLGRLRGLEHVWGCKIRVITSLTDNRRADAVYRRLNYIPDLHFNSDRQPKVQWGRGIPP